MSPAIFSGSQGRALLDIRSLGRRGPVRRDSVTPTEVEIMRRTLRRDLEIVVKVVSKAGQDLKAAVQHLRYISRDGDVELIDDEGQRLTGSDAAKAVVQDWNLELMEHGSGFDLKLTDKRKRPNRFTN